MTKMINQEKFMQLKGAYDSADKKRDKIINMSRSIVKQSKRLINSVHRDENKKAWDFENQMQESIAEMIDAAKNDPRLFYQGSYKVAIQEYVEGIIYLNFVEKHNLINIDEIKDRLTEKLNKFEISEKVKDSWLDYENYLLGVCDSVGELSRRTVNQAIKENYSEVLKIKDFLSELYSLMLEFDFRNSELRKKFDGIKWELKKIEGTIFDLKMKDKI